MPWLWSWTAYGMALTISTRYEPRLGRIGMRGFAVHETKNMVAQIPKIPASLGWQFYSWRLRSTHGTHPKKSNNSIFTTWNPNLYFLLKIYYKITNIKETPLLLFIFYIHQYNNRNKTETLERCNQSTFGFWLICFLFSRILSFLLSLHYYWSSVAVSLPTRPW